MLSLEFIYIAVDRSRVAVLFGKSKQFLEEPFPSGAWIENRSTGKLERCVGEKLLTEVASSVRL